MTQTNQNKAISFSQRFGTLTSEGGYLSTVAKDLVAERSTLGTRVSEYSGSRCVLVLDEVAIAFENLELFIHTELHSCSSFLATGQTVTPTCQCRITGHLAYKLCRNNVVNYEIKVVSKGWCCTQRNSLFLAFSFTPKERAQYLPSKLPHIQLQVRVLMVKIW